MEDRPSASTRSFTRRDLLAAAFITAFLVPNLATLVIPFEQFPFSSAPMFAHYVSDDTPRYRFRFMVEPPDGRKTWELLGRDLGMHNVEFGRYFFGSVYGSIDPVSPYGHHGHDTREAFEARLSEFFDKLVSVWERRRSEPFPRPAAIRLELALLDRENRNTEIRTVGRYDVATRRFLHTWGRQP